jgi:RNA polymerase sigma factor (sigma-70 family)
VAKSHVADKSWGERAEQVRPYLRSEAKGRIPRWLVPKFDASDAAAKAIAEAFEKRDQYDPSCDLGPLLYGYLINVILTAIRLYTGQGRSYKREVGRPAASQADSSVGDPLGQLAASITPPSGKARGEERSQLLALALGQLVSEDLEVVMLRYRDNLTPEEIARRLGKTVGAVRTRYWRAQRKMRVYLQQFDEFTDAES